MPLNIPNLLTWLRILLIPLIVGVYYMPESWLSFEGKNITATSIFIFAAITDWLDGYLARALNQMSSFGAFLDETYGTPLIALEYMLGTLMTWWSTK